VIGPEDLPPHFDSAETQYVSGNIREDMEKR
jgi:hypothetical protein